MLRREELLPYLGIDSVHRQSSALALVLVP
jgi:hypothetical protein